MPMGAVPGALAAHRELRGDTLCGTGASRVFRTALSEPGIYTLGDSFFAECRSVRCCRNSIEHEKMGFRWEMAPSCADRCCPDVRDPHHDSPHYADART